MISAITITTTIAHIVDNLPFLNTDFTQNRSNKNECVDSIHLTAQKLRNPDGMMAVEGNLTLDTSIDEADDSAATLVVEGVLDRKSYYEFLMQTKRLYHDGISNLTLDMTNVIQVDLSGIYALHAAAKIFRGEQYPRYEYGYAGLRHMVEENLQVVPHQHIRLTGVNEHVQKTLEQAGVTELFGA